MVAILAIGLFDVYGVLYGQIVVSANRLYGLLAVSELSSLATAHTRAQRAIARVGGTVGIAAGVWQMKKGQPGKRFERIASKPEHEEVIKLVNQGLTYQAIADRISLSIRTIIRYVNASYYADSAYEDK
jgi:hypothetical protein